MTDSMITLMDLPAYDEEEPEGFNWIGAIPGDRKTAVVVEGHLNAISVEIRMGGDLRYVMGLRRALNIFAERIYVQ